MNDGIFEITCDANTADQLCAATAAAHENMIGYVEIKAPNGVSLHLFSASDLTHRPVLPTGESSRA